MRAGSCRSDASFETNGGRIDGIRDRRLANRSALGRGLVKGAAAGRAGGHRLHRRFSCTRVTGEQGCRTRRRCRSKSAACRVVCPGVRSRPGLWLADGDASRRFARCSAHPYAARHACRRRPRGGRSRSRRASGKTARRAVAKSRRVVRIGGRARCHTRRQPQLSVQRTVRKFARRCSSRSARTHRFRNDHLESRAGVRHAGPVRRLDASRSGEHHARSRRALDRSRVGIARALRQLASRRVESQTSADRCDLFSPLAGANAGGGRSCGAELFVRPRRHRARDSRAGNVRGGDGRSRKQHLHARSPHVAFARVRPVFPPTAARDIGGRAGRTEFVPACVFKTQAGQAGKCLRREHCGQRRRILSAIARRASRSPHLRAVRLRGRDSGRTDRPTRRAGGFATLDSGSIGFATDYQDTAPSARVGRQRFHRT